MKWINVVFSLNEDTKMTACSGSGDYAVLFYSARRALLSDQSNERLKHGIVRLLSIQFMNDNNVDGDYLCDTHISTERFLELPFRKQSKLLQRSLANCIDFDFKPYFEIYKQHMFDVEGEVIK